MLKEGVVCFFLFYMMYCWFISFGILKRLFHIYKWWVYFQDDLCTQVKNSSSNRQSEGRCEWSNWLFFPFPFLTGTAAAALPQILVFCALPFVYGGALQWGPFKLPQPEEGCPQRPPPSSSNSSSVQETGQAAHPQLRKGLDARGGVSFWAQVDRFPLPSFSLSLSLPLPPLYLLSVFFRLASSSPHIGSPPTSHTLHDVWPWGARVPTILVLKRQTVFWRCGIPVLSEWRSCRLLIAV